MTFHEMRIRWWTAVWNASRVILFCTVGQEQWSRCSMQVKKWGPVLQSVHPSR